MPVNVKGTGTFLVKDEDGKTMPLMLRERTTYVLEATTGASARTASGLLSKVGVVSIVATADVFFNHGTSTVVADDPASDGESGFLPAGVMLDLPLIAEERYIAAKSVTEAGRVYVMVRG